VTEPRPPFTRGDAITVASLVAGGALLAGLEGGIVALPAAIVGRTRPRLVTAYAGLALLAAGGATLLEGNLDRGGFGGFVAERPTAGSLGRMAGVLLMVGLVWSLRRERAITSSEAVGTVPSSARRGPVMAFVWRLPRGHRDLLTGSSLVMAAFVVQAITGLVFWLLAARRFDAATVGISAGLMASLQFINYLTAFGLPELLSRYRPRPTGSDSLLTWALTATAIGSLLGVAVYPLVVVSASTSLLTAEGAFGFLVFFGCTTGAAMGLLADIRLMGQRRWHLVLVRLGTTGVIRIPLLVLGPGPLDPGLWLFLISAGPLALSAVPATAAALHGHRLGWSTGDLPAPPRRALRYAGLNHLAHVAVYAPQFALPVIVLAHVPAADNATFYVAWNIAAVIMVLPVTVGRVLLVEGSRSLQTLWPATRAALVISGLVAISAFLGCLALRWTIPLVYGSDYQDTADLLLPLVGGAVPWAFTSVALAAFRVLADGRRLLMTTGLLAGSVLGLAAVTVPAGGTGAAATAWLVGNLLAAAVGGVLLISRVRQRPRDGAPDHELLPVEAGGTDTRTFAGGATSGAS
jgi:O-antigen/teichoic acid export membrane protein